MTDYQDFNRILAFHTAPTLLGIKCANLVSISTDAFDIAYQTAYFNARAKSKGLQCQVLCQCRNKTLVLVYRRPLLEARLAQPEIRHLLRQCGYTDFSLQGSLERLAERMAYSEEFPHEIGVFLGYPLEDVEGFIANRGENFKCCGCWKVYGCPESAKRTFANYEKCRIFLCNKLNQGIDMYQALKIS